MNEKYMSRRKSVGNFVIQGQTFAKRQGRSVELCDHIPQPDDEMLILRKIGDYEHFADAKHISKVIQLLSTTSSEYAFTSSIYFALDENLKRKKDVQPTIGAYELPLKFRHNAAKAVLRENPKAGYHRAP